MSRRSWVMGTESQVEGGVQVGNASPWFAPSLALPSDCPLASCGLAWHRRVLRCREWVGR